MKISANPTAFKGTIVTTNSHNEKLAINLDNVVKASELNQGNVTLQYTNGESEVLDCKFNDYLMTLKVATGKEVVEVPHKGGSRRVG